MCFSASLSVLFNYCYMNLNEIDCEVVDWFHLSLDKDRWRTFVSKVMNFRTA